VEFGVKIFRALKSLENNHRYGKVWKNRRTPRLTWKIYVFITLVATAASVTFLAFHQSEELSFYKSFESRNIQRGYSAQTAYTVCSLKKFWQ